MKSLVFSLAEFFVNSLFLIFYLFILEVSKVLEDKFSGSFVPCLESCNYSAQKLLNIILDNFDCYHDISEIQGQRVAILKRAQILVSDLWALFEGKGLGRFDDIESLSMFADYRVPQSLQYFKIFEYSPELVRRHASDNYIKKSSNF